MTTRLVTLTVYALLVCTNVHALTKVETARSIDDLRYVLGSNYKLFVASYWRFLISSCDVLGDKMLEDLSNGYLEKYCLFVNKCPDLYITQSCLITTVAFSIRVTCCPVSDLQTDLQKITTTEMPIVNKEPPASTASTERACSNGVVPVFSKIYGGTATERGEFPWIAMLLVNGVLECSGIILDYTHLLTAAHCFFSDSAKYEVVAGKYNRSPDVSEVGAQRVRVKSYKLHENYNQKTTNNDIAMITLESPLQWSEYVNFACLPRPEHKAEARCMVAGWGYINSGNMYPEVLMKTELDVYNSTQCLKIFNQTAQPPGILSTILNEGTICAANGTSGGKDACGGDSGGPLMCVQSSANGPAYFVYGIVSNGNGCAKVGEPGIYTNVPYYLDWIRKNKN
ncbi:mite allergen Der f 3-like [Physella acuta]|uniref:mite allergen Der f 3-like n=1 Tax=Physella acuta TaxID=109671 RepID=UPI0027DE02E1|nr:mite allergen Der f 3-like [Physella acuta]